MIDNYTYAELFLENKVQKNFIITDGVVSIAGGSFVYNDYTYLLTNDDLKSVPKIYEMLTDEKDLDFGRCNSNYIEFQIAANVIPLIGKNCRVYLWMNDDKDTLFKVGRYKITSDKATADRNYRNIVAYDKLNEMKSADVTSWYNSLFPSESSVISVKQMRESFCQNFNIDDITDTTDMVNDSVVFGKTITPSDGGFIDGDTILRAVCAINGGFGNISRNGDFRCIVLKSGLVGLYPRVDLYPSPDLYPREEVTTMIGAAYYIPPLAYEDYYTERITCVQIREDDDDLGVSVGTAGNDYIMEGNFICFGKTASELETIATRLLSKIEGMSFMPFNVRAFGNPCFEVGDAVRFRTGDVVVNTYILKRTLVGTIALEDEYEAVGNQYRSDSTTNLANDITKLKSKTLKINRSVDEFSIELQDFESETEAEFTVQSGRINAKVSYGEVSSQLSIEPDQVTLSSNRLIVNSTNFTLDGQGNATFSGTVDAATITGGDIIGANIYSQGSDAWAELYSGQLLVKPDMSSSSYVSIQTSYDQRISGYVPEIYVIGGSSRCIIQSDYISLYNGGLTTMITPGNITIGGDSVILNSSSSGIEVQSGGLALNAPNYSGWVHVGYQSSAVTIGNSGTNLRVMGHAVDYIECVARDGGIVQLLGYYS